MTLFPDFEAIPDNIAHIAISEPMKKSLIFISTKRTGASSGHGPSLSLNICQQSFLTKLPKEGTDSFITLPFPYVIEVGHMGVSVTTH